MKWMREECKSDRETERTQKQRVQFPECVRSHRAIVGLHDRSHEGKVGQKGEGQGKVTAAVCVRLVALFAYLGVLGAKLPFYEQTVCCFDVTSRGSQSSVLELLPL